MPLPGRGRYETPDFMSRATGQAQGAYQAMGSQTREGPRTEYEAGPTNPANVASNVMGVGMTLDNAWDKGVKYYNKWFGAPDAASQAANAEAGGQAIAQGLNGAGVQMNTGAQVTGSHIYDTFYQPDALTGLSGEGVANTGSASAAGGNAGAMGAGGWMGSAVGGVAGGLGGRELGRAIGGDTGATIGGIAGSLGGAYLGGMASSALGAASGAAAGTGAAAAGAAAGSFVPGLGTVIGAGIGALSSFFF